MSATRLQHSPNFPPFCICWQVWAPLALSNKLDSGYFPDCLLRKVLAHPRVLCSWLWLMGKLLRIIVLQKDASVLLPVLLVCDWEGRRVFRFCVRLKGQVAARETVSALKAVIKCSWRGFDLYMSKCKCRDSNTVNELFLLTIFHGFHLQFFGAWRSVCFEVIWRCKVLHHD